MGKENILTHVHNVTIKITIIVILDAHYSFITGKKYTSSFNISRFYQSKYFVTCEGVNENINYNIDSNLKENIDQIIATFTCGSKLYARLNT